LHDASGDWLSVRVARERYGFSPDNLQTWRSRPCPQLGGRKLRAQFVSLVDRSCGHKKRWVHHAEDLARIAAGLQQDNDWLTGSEAQERYGFSTMILYLWCRRGCLHLGGRKLRSRKAPRSTSHGRGENRERIRLLRVYAREDLDTITRNQRIAPEATADPDWLTYQEAKQLYGLNQAMLSNWRLQGAPALGGRQLGARKVVAGVGNRMMAVWKYARADLVKIAEAKYGNSAASHTPAQPEPTPAPSSSTRRGGRPSDTAKDVQKFCYEQYNLGTKLAKIRVEAVRLFGEKSAPKQDGHVTTNAQRYADKHGLPLDRPSD
jgi:hypothetical protein